MGYIKKTKNFDEIYWHDSVLRSIEFDLLDDRIKLYVDLNVTNVDSIHYQPCIALFNYVHDLKINLQWESSNIFPEISYIERILIEKPANVVNNLGYYSYTIHFIEPTFGKIEFPMITDFELLHLSEPILVTNDEEYNIKRNEILERLIKNQQ